MLTDSTLLSSTGELSFRQSFSSFKAWRYIGSILFWVLKTIPQALNRFHKYVHAFRECCFINQVNASHSLDVLSKSEPGLHRSFMVYRNWINRPRGFLSRLRISRHALRNFSEVNTCSLSSPPPDCWSTVSTAATWRTPRRLWMS